MIQTSKIIRKDIGIGVGLVFGLTTGAVFGARIIGTGLVQQREFSASSILRIDGEDQNSSDNVNVEELEADIQYLEKEKQTEEKDIESIDSALRYGTTEEQISLANELKYKDPLLENETVNEETVVTVLYKLVGSADAVIHHTQQEIDELKAQVAAKNPDSDINRSQDEEK